MAERLHPGVYVEEVDGGARPIQGVGTSTGALVGEANRGIPDQAVLVTSYEDYERLYGGHLVGDRGFLGHAVQAFFDAGGRRAFVVRVLPSDASAAVLEGGPLASRQSGGSNPAPSIDARAIGKGVWASSVRLVIADATNFPDTCFRVEVYWTEGGTSRRIEAFDDLSMNPDSDDYFAEVINTKSRYVRVSDEFGAALDEGGYDAVAAVVPQLQASTTTGTASTYTVYEGVTLEFNWTDGAGVAHAPLRVTFDAATFAAASVGAGVKFEDGVAKLGRQDLKKVLATGVKSDVHFDVSVSNNAATGAGPIVAPTIATRGRLEIATPSGTLPDLATKDLSVTIAGRTYEIAAKATLTAQQLADKLTAALGPRNPVTVTATKIVVSTEPDASGTTPAVAEVPAAGPVLAVSATKGTGGQVVETLDAVAISVTEVPSRFFPKTLTNLGFATRASGYEENSRRNPVIRPAESTVPLRLVGGSDGTGRPGVTEFRGSEDAQTGLHALDRSEINLLALPGKNDVAYLNLGMSYCENRGDCFFVADGPGDIDEDLVVGPAMAKSFIEGLPNRSNNAAMFYPWISIADPIGVGRNPTCFVPPSGHVAGIFARTDITRGVWKAPAGIEATVSGALGLQYQLIDREQDLLNPVSMNCLRALPGVGIVSWGSRTLSADPAWRYVPVRRTALFLKESLRRGLQWAVFEPNDEDLWDRIRVAIESFMLSLFRQGAFQGSTPDEAFLVRCDRSTNPQERIDEGIVTARVAFAPLKPAEFVVIEVSQKTLVSA